ncbi:polysaccharide deacetylase family protein [Aquincola sp. MAHUQ-54]|uniref:Polysaccharide deacetylase family protein n=1 Tax=Aquincola agrisoli TaxID=3119538 RepID=A0AAW9QBK9_9BURK
MSGISIFMYHQVGRFAPMKTHRASYCDVDRFRSQMRALRRFGVKVLSMGQAVAALRGEAPMPERAAVLTFDDGCENFYEHALPILQDHGYPSIVYPIAGQLGGSAAWLAAEGHPTPPLMTAARLREIAALGVEIGSHALNHVRLAEQPVDVQRSELRDSRERLQHELGREVAHVCYPYGSHSIDTLMAAAEAGYTSGVTCQRGAATPAFDPLALPRKAISYGDDVVGFLWKLYLKDAPKGEALARPGHADCRA